MMDDVPAMPGWEAATTNTNPSFCRRGPLPGSDRVPRFSLLEIWNRASPGQQIRCISASGNHHTMMTPPHLAVLG